MQFSAFFAAIMATAVFAAPQPEANNEVAARGDYDCGYGAYWGKDCCKCHDPKNVYNPHWHGCSRPNVEIDIQFGCHNGSFWDYHRGVCACPNPEINIYISSLKTCGTCGHGAHYSYEHNDCFCDRKDHSYDWKKHGCYPKHHHKDY